MNFSIEFKNDYITPQKQAEFLARHGHLEGIIIPKGRAHVMEKYFTFRGQGFRVIYVENAVAQIIKMKEDEIKRIIACSKLKFGGF